MKENPSEWTAAVGAVTVILILAALGLSVGMGPKNFSKFILEGSANGWTQAVGSIGAIFASFIVMNRQNEHQRTRDLEAEKAVAVRRLLAVKAACLQAEEVVAWMSVESIPGPRSELTALEFASGEALAAFKAIAFADIPDDSLLESCGAVRKDIVSVLIHCRAVKELTGIDSYGFFEHHCVRLHGNLLEAKFRISQLVQKLRPAP